MKWYEKSFINRTNWLLDNLANLNLTVEESLLVLMISYLNDQKEEITVEILVKKTAMSSKVVDATLGKLFAKHYVKVKPEGVNLRFDLDGIFEAEIAQEEDPMLRPILDSFEDEFKRLLTTNEIMSISDLIGKYEHRLIIYALREASFFKVSNVAYVAKILSDWKLKGYTADMIESGVRNEKS